MTVETRVCAINGPIHHVSQEDCSIRSFKRSYIINRCCGFSPFLSFHSRMVELSVSWKFYWQGSVSLSFVENHRWLSCKVNFLFEEKGRENKKRGEGGIGWPGENFPHKSSYLIAFFVGFFNMTGLRGQMATRSLPQHVTRRVFQLTEGNDFREKMKIRGPDVSRAKPVLWLSHRFLLSPRLSHRDKLDFFLPSHFLRLNSFRNRLFW